MQNIDAIFFFIFVFSLLVFFKNLMKFIGSLFHSNPKKIVLSNRELITLALSISYLITYIFYK